MYLFLVKLTLLRLHFTSSPLTLLLHSSHLFTYSCTISYVANILLITNQYILSQVTCIATQHFFSLAFLTSLWWPPAFLSPTVLHTPRSPQPPHLRGFLCIHTLSLPFMIPSTSFHSMHSHCLISYQFSPHSFFCLLNTHSNLCSPPPSLIFLSMALS